MPLPPKWIVRTLALLTFLALNAVASAQGTQGVAPDPLTTGKLNDYLSWYLPDATREQLIAIDAAHEEYLIAFRAIRNGEIEQLLKILRSARRDADQVTSVFRQMRLVRQVVSDADDRFFASILAILGSEQTAFVQRARDARERDCLGDAPMLSMDGGEGVPDLVQMLAARRLADAQMRQVIALLAEHELRATQAQRQLVRESEELGTALATKMAEVQKQFEAGTVDSTAWERAIAEAVEKDGASFVRARKAMKQIVSSGIDSLHEILDASEWHLLAVRACSRSASGMIPDGVNPPIGAIIRRVLKKESLDAAQHEGIMQVLREWADADVRLAREALDAFSTGLPNVMGMDGAELHTALNLTNQRREENAVAAWDRLAAVLGEVAVRRYAARDGSNGEAMPYGPVDDDAEFEAQQQASERANENYARAANGQARYSSEFQPISAPELSEVMAFTGVDDAQSEILEQAHAAYLERFTARMEPATRRTSDARDALYAPQHEVQVEGPVLEEAHGSDAPAEVTSTASSADEGSPTEAAEPMAQVYQPPSIDRARVEHYIAAQVAMFDLALALDAEFASECTAALGAEVPIGDHRIAPILRSLRLLDLVTKGSQGWSFGLREECVTPVELFLKVEFGNGALEAFSKQSAIETASRLPALQGIAHALYEGSRRSEFLWQNLELDGPQDPDAATRRFQEWRQKERALEGEGAVLLRSALDAALATTSESVQAAAAVARRKLAYPAVFRDSRDATPMLHAALALSDLDATRRGQIEGLLAEYQMLYDDACERILAIPQSSIESETDPEYWVERTARAMEFERLQFERGERSAKAIIMLRRILGDADVARIPGLATYDMRAGVRDQSME